ncbi:hypothetical protein DIE15_10035 [Burkholderia sp. Bp9031]|nr:hypothetical protein DIE15_10035 [Burkholderia sp. Bp9031]
MPRHHCGLPKNGPHAHYVRRPQGGGRHSWRGPASTDGGPHAHYVRCPPRGRSALLGRPGEYRQTKTPRCLPGCL